MVYQLLKDIVQLLGGKESRTTAEQSILERSSKVITTMRNPEDSELLKKDELLIRYCPATKHPVLVYYDGDGMCSCLHNDTVEEDMGCEALAKRDDTRTNQQQYELRQRRRVNG